MRVGAAIFAGGLIKKVLFADNLAPIVEKLYAAPAALDFGASWLGTLAFAFQIYFDFSGYSEMAIGLAWMMGVRLPRNFIYPYIARSPSEFWRRWHITLSQWLRDYLYISLGGSRRGTGRTYFNLMMTMFLGGLWHGANWTFAVWGVMHGCYLVGARLLEGVYRQTGIAASSLGSRLAVVGRNAGHLRAGLLHLGVLPGARFRVCLAHRQRDAGDGAPGRQHAADSELRNRNRRRFGDPGVRRAAHRRAIAENGNRRLVDESPFPLRGTAYAVVALMLIVFGGTTQKFIYFDF